MKKHLADIIKGFKPQFGNANHLRALEIIGKIRRKEALEKKRDDTLDEIEDEIEDINAELDFEEKNLEYLIKSKI